MATSGGRISKIGDLKVVLEELSRRLRLGAHPALNAVEDAWPRGLVGHLLSTIRNEWASGIVCQPTSMQTRKQTHRQQLYITSPGAAACSALTIFILVLRTLKQTPDSLLNQGASNATAHQGPNPLVVNLADIGPERIPLMAVFVEINLLRHILGAITSGLGLFGLLITANVAQEEVVRQGSQKRYWREHVVGEEKQRV
jgi:hypothetical protein